MQRTFTYLKYIVGLSAITLVTLVATLISLNPVVERQIPPNVQDFVNSSTLAKRAYHQLNLNDAGFTAYVSKEELASLTAIANTRIPNTRIMYNIHDNSAYINVSRSLLNGRLWINGKSQVTEGSALSIKNLTIGKLTLPDSLAAKLTDLAAQKTLGVNLAAINKYINSIRIANSHIEIKGNRPEGLSRYFSQFISNVHTISSSSSLPKQGSLEEYQAYFLERSKSVTAIKDNHSLAFYLSELHLAVAKQLRMNTNAKIKSEYQTAILALALHTNSSYLQTLIPSSGKTYQEIPIRLDSRTDLAKHFLVSAALKVISDNSTSKDIGEAKELIDSSNGGSGFSFKDIAADRAGIKYVDLITTLPKESVLKILISKETDFFPNVSDLKEGITHSEFESHYTNTQSAAYKKTIAVIDARISATAIYN